MERLRVIVSILIFFIAGGAVADEYVQEQVTVGIIESCRAKGLELQKKAEEHPEIPAYKWIYNNWMKSCDAEEENLNAQDKQALKDKRVDNLQKAQEKVAPKFKPQSTPQETEEFHVN